MSDTDLNGWWRLGIGVVGPICRLLFRLRYVGLENIPATGPAILAANHLSFLDGVVLGLAPATGRRRAIRFLVAAEFFKSRVFGFFLRRFSQIPIRRGEGDASALDEAVETIRAGALAGIFPEGKINDGIELQRGRTGVARIALAAGVPVIPVGIWGTHARWPRKGLNFRRPLRTRITLSVGEPIEPGGDVDSVEDVQDFTDRVMGRIADQVAASRAEVEATARRRPR